MTCRRAGGWLCGWQEEGEGEEKRKTKNLIRQREVRWVEAVTGMHGCSGLLW